MGTLSQQIELAISERLGSGRPGSGSRGRTAGHTDHGQTTHGQMLTRRVRRYGPAVAMLAVVGLIVGGLVVALVVRNSVQTMIAKSLESVRQANASAVKLWMVAQASEADSLAAVPAIAQDAADLIRQSGQAFDWTSDQLELDGPLGSLNARLDHDRYLAWILLDTDSQVIAATASSLVGTRLPIADEVQGKLSRQQSTVTRPMWLPAASRVSTSPTETQQPIMLAIAPITSESEVVGGLALAIDPGLRFTDLFSIAKIGDTGQTFAFDRDGRILSRCRHEDQLRRIGLLEASPTSILGVDIRDPGVNLVTGGVAVVPRPKQPLTWMADQATAGGTGTRVTAYNDFRGVPVVGSWTWLDEYHLGIATEIEAAEAFAPTRLISRLMIGLLTLATTVATAALMVGLWTRRLDHRRALIAPPNRRLGQYELGETLGRGGMGAVYRGTHAWLRRPVAIKVLEGDQIGSQAVARFEREVQMTASLRHPNTIILYDFGRTDEGTFYYVMEHIDGITLQTLIDVYGAQPPGRVISLLIQICGSLGEAHQLGLVHRDIKPANIMLSVLPGVPDWIKVLDFGLVKDLVHQPGDMTLTQSEGITGTPMYMSPETVRDAAMSDHRSDIYSLGGVGYALLCGAPMYDGDSSVDVCMKQLREDPLRPADRIGRDLPEDLQNILMSCLRKDPDERPSSIDELAMMLDQCVDAGAWRTDDALRWWDEVFDDSRGGVDRDAPSADRTRV